MTTASVTLTFDQLANAGLTIEQSIFTMGPGEWYCDTQGPFTTPEGAALAGITRVVDRYHDCRPMWDDDSDSASLRGVRPFARRTPLEAEEPTW
jgi:hypothetical protein